VPGASVDRTDQIGNEPGDAHPSHSSPRITSAWSTDRISSGIRSEVGGGRRRSLLSNSRGAVTDPTEPQIDATPHYLADEIEPGISTGIPTASAKALNSSKQAGIPVVAPCPANE
jgi:hypothetical protein